MSPVIGFGLLALTTTMPPPLCLYVCTALDTDPNVNHAPSASMRTKTTFWAGRLT
jgi:hypothetical protein